MAPLFIAGEWRAAGDQGSFAVVDPATEEIIGHAAAATSMDVAAAAESAWRAWESWRAEDPWVRSSVLRRAAAIVHERRHEIARRLTCEQGKPLREAEAEVVASAEIIDWCADEARRIYGRVIPARSDGTRLLVTRHPVGPVAAFTASNFPALLPARKLAAAFAAGCSVVLKPAEDTPFTARELGLAFEAAGLPPGVLNIVTGDPERISAELLSAPQIRKVSLTGSTLVGRALLARAADRIIPSSMELGGHAIGIVCPDADIENVADAVVRGKWRNGGQVCIAVSRLLVHEDIAGTFVDLLTNKVAALRVGPGTDPQAEVGPLANQRALVRTEGLLADAVQCGAEVLIGGGRAKAHSTGYFFTPTVVSGAAQQARIWTEEPFGPVLPIRTYRDLDDAIAFGNQSAYGLAGYVFTRDLRTAMVVSDRLEVGMIGVNNLVIATAEAPVGGVKESGFGREGGAEAVLDYTTLKYTNIAL